MSPLRLDLEWRTTALTILLLPALVWLGFWQLDRAEEKSAIAEQYQQRAQATPLPLASALDTTPDQAAWRRVILRGSFIEGATILIDNQVRDGRYGHDVISLFVDDSSARVVLLNRGWIPGDSSRRSLPDVDVPKGSQRFLASIYVSPGKPYLLQEQDFGELHWPLLVQSAVAPELYRAIAEHTNLRVYPFELRLLPDQSAGYRRDWPVVNVSVQKHRGYALQWFTMAAALLLLFVIRSSNLGSLVRGKRDSLSP